jgi:Ca-activated chloride channel homolog
MIAEKRRLFAPVAILSLIWFVRAQDKVPTFRVDVSTVYLNASVADPFNRYVTGLQKSDFKVYEDGKEQTILYFGQQSVPVSLGYIYDISGSMGFSGNMKLGRNWFRRLLSIKNALPADECFLITFNDKINLAQNFEYESAELLDDIVQKPGGWTALYDAIYRGISKVREGRNERKALIVISDGEENSSAYKWKEIREFAEESNVIIYAVALFGPGGDPGAISSPAERNSPLKQIAALTGGRVFFPVLNDFSRIVEIIHSELRSQYLIGYAPTNATPDGQWRKLKVELELPAGYPRLSIRTRNGYHAPKY